MRQRTASSYDSAHLNRVALAFAEYMAGDAREATKDLDKLARRPVATLEPGGEIEASAAVQGFLQKRLRSLLSDIPDRVILALCAAYADYVVGDGSAVDFFESYIRTASRYEMSEPVKDEVFVLAKKAVIRAL